MLTAFVDAIEFRFGCPHFNLDPAVVALNVMALVYSVDTSEAISSIIYAEDYEHETFEDFISHCGAMLQLKGPPGVKPGEHAEFYEDFFGDFDVAEPDSFLDGYQGTEFGDLLEADDWFSTPTLRELVASI